LKLNIISLSSSSSLQKYNILKLNKKITKKEKNQNTLLLLLVCTTITLSICFVLTGSDGFYYSAQQKRATLPS